MAVRTLEEIRRETVDGLSDGDITSALGAIADVLSNVTHFRQGAAAERERAEQFAKVLAIVSDVVLHTWSDARSAADE